MYNDKCHLSSPDSPNIKKAKKPNIDYLTLDAMKYFMPDSKTKEGRQDLVLLSLLYDSGARVQELADLKVSDVRTTEPATFKLTGKPRIDGEMKRKALEKSTNNVVSNNFTLAL